MAEFLVERIHGLGTLDAEETVDTGLDRLLGRCELRGVDIGLRLCELVGEIISDGDGDNEVSVRQTLHKG